MSDRDWIDDELEASTHPTNDSTSFEVGERLGYLKGGAEDVVCQSWFAPPEQPPFDWDGLMNLVLPPPWRPTLKSADDTSHFDDDGKRECLRAQQLEAAMMMTPEEEEKWAHVWSHFGPTQN